MPNERIIQTTDIAKALADETRLRLLMALRERELCVCQMQSMVNLSLSSVSEHLAKLRRAGLVMSRKQGRWVYFRLAGGDAGKLVRSTLEWLDQHLSTEAQVREDEQKLQQILAEPADLCQV